ncbi:hypothetical protein [Solimonas sp. SE-A11]|uniref:hypothetical protein n=1 Tax=Solimonas sp. SE-A11 TaxID=3054954 RepID=UPI00259CE6DE|nr:hypothetical protein [Solimonas sp. SE-A11]MDM4771401.1 hypothetical protein [Solimonas sp. SE-A11]
MNTLFRSTLVAAAVLFAQGSWAHDPAEHAKEAAAAKAGPDCASMKNMDMSKMDMNDPVAKAMHEKCMGQKKPADGMGGMDHSQMKGMDQKSGSGKPPADGHGGH